MICCWTNVLFTLLLINQRNLNQKKWTKHEKYYKGHASISQGTPK